MNEPPLNQPTLARSTHLRIAGTNCLVHTNSQSLCDALSAWTAERDNSPHQALTITVQVDGKDENLEPSHFRGMGHMVTAVYGKQTFLFDLHRRAVHAWISAPIAANADLWSRRFVPLILGIMGCTVGILPLHSACVVKDGRGILIAGESMAGKSTLSVALAKQGFHLLSDDWTYIRLDHQALVAHGLNVPVKLLLDAAQHFPELRRFTPVRTSNGEIAYEIYAKQALGLRTASSCSPEAIVFLERMRDGASKLVPASAAYVREYVNNSIDRLPPELEGTQRERQFLIDALSNLPSWTFRYSGSAQAGATFLAHSLTSLQKVVTQ
jgi:hypothetical protein